MPEDLQLLLVDSGATRPGTDMPESEEMVARSCALDGQYRYYKAYTLLMDMIPALRSGNLETYGRLNWEFQFAGTHTSMIQAYEDHGLTLLEAMHVLREAGAEIVGMSSVGPCVYALSKDLTRIEEQCQRSGYGFRRFLVDNVGITRVNPPCLAGQARG